MPDPIPSFDRAEFVHDTPPASAVSSTFGPNDFDDASASANHAAYLRAIGFGAAAAIAGCALYAVVQIATGWTIGYVALAVGYMVGKAMRSGSAGRGGRRYQIVAALLTYAAVSLAAIPVAMHGHARMHLSPMLIAIGLASPFIELAGGVGGIIGLFILFIGIRAAWQLTAGTETPVLLPRSPGRPGTPRIF